MPRPIGTIDMHRGRWRVRLTLPDGTRRPFLAPDGYTREQAEEWRGALLADLRGTALDPSIRASRSVGAWAQMATVYASSSSRCASRRRCCGTHAHPRDELAVLAHRCVGAGARNDDERGVMWPVLGREEDRMTEMRSDAAGTIDATAPAETIGGYALWEVYDGGETFWMAVREGESAISLLADEHGMSAEDMAESGAEARRTTVGDALTKRIGDEDRPGVTQTLWEAFGQMVADLSAGRSATRCVGATVW